VFYIPEITMAIVTHEILTGIPISVHPSGSVGGSSSGWVGRIVGRWRERVRERREFAALDRRDMRDLGLSEWEVQLELAKPFWQE
jgi:uncharacterized protein YjiS (DUF1127 family)